MPMGQLGQGGGGAKLSKGLAMTYSDLYII
jgi:hypothetical protein